MTKIKLCGLSRICDIEEANKLKPEYIGFVFAKKSKRYVNAQRAAELKASLSSDIEAVGVFVNDSIENITSISKDGTIDIIQLHGNEDEAYITQLKELTGKPIIKAFKIDETADFACMEQCSADYILLDSGAGTGTVFNWNLIKNIGRPYFLAGGLGVENVGTAVEQLKPYAVDVSSGIESNGLKDIIKMAAFVATARKESENDKS